MESFYSKLSEKPNKTINHKKTTIIKRIKTEETEYYGHETPQSNLNS